MSIDVLNAKYTFRRSTDGDFFPQAAKCQATALERSFNHKDVIGLISIHSIWCYMQRQGVVRVAAASSSTTALLFCRKQIFAIAAPVILISGINTTATETLQTSFTNIFLLINDNRIYTFQRTESIRHSCAHSKSNFNV